jgi:spore coat protein U-like protein
MMTRFLRLLLPLALALAFVSPAYGHSGCNAQLADVEDIDDIQYDPFQGVTVAVSFNVTFQNNDSVSCVLGVAVSREGNDGQRQLKKGSNQLLYTLKAPGGIEVPNSLSSPIGQLTVAAGKRASLRLKLEVPAGQIGQAGEYRDTLVLRGYSMDGGVSPLGGGDRVEHAEANVASRAQVNIAGAAGSFGVPFAVDTIDFGNMVTGAERNAFVQIRATDDVTITVTSQNHGKLLHTSLKQQTGNVAYMLKLDSQALNLGYGSASIDRHPPITLDGISYPLSVRIGNVSGLLAGTYQDLVTVSVCPN